MGKHDTALKYKQVLALSEKYRDLMQAIDNHGGTGFKPFQKSLYELTIIHRVIKPVKKDKKNDELASSSSKGSEKSQAIGEQIFGALTRYLSASTPTSKIKLPDKREDLVLESLVDKLMTDSALNLKKIETFNEISNLAFTPAMLESYKVDIQPMLNQILQKQVGASNESPVDPTLSARIGKEVFATNLQVAFHALKLIKDINQISKSLSKSVSEWQVDFEVLVSLITQRIDSARQGKEQMSDTTSSSSRERSGNVFDRPILQEEKISLSKSFTDLGKAEAEDALIRRTGSMPPLSPTKKKPLLQRRAAFNNSSSSLSLPFSLEKEEGSNKSDSEITAASSASPLASSSPPVERNKKEVFIEPVKTPPRRLSYLSASPPASHKRRSSEIRRDAVEKEIKADTPIESASRGYDGDEDQDVLGPMRLFAKTSSSSSKRRSAPAKPRSDVEIKPKKR